MDNTMILLHEGSFTDYDGGDVCVQFYKLYNLNVVPERLNFDAEGGTKTVKVWSTKGSAELTFRNCPDWITQIRQINAEQLPGSNEYKYTYEVTCSSNGFLSSRDYYADVWIESGEGTGVATRNLIIHQYGQGSPSVDTMSVVPTSIRYSVSGGTNGITVTWTAGVEPTINLVNVTGETGWLVQNGDGYLSDYNVKEWSFTATENDELIERQAVIYISNGTGVDLTVNVYQNRQ